MKPKLPKQHVMAITEARQWTHKEGTCVISSVSFLFSMFFMNAKCIQDAEADSKQSFAGVLYKVTIGYIYKNNWDTVW